MRNFFLLVALTTLLGTWACSPDDDDDSTTTNTNSSSGQTNSTPATLPEPALSADAITFALAEDSGDDNDKITTNANVVISGTIPDDAELSFVVMTNQTNHSNDVTEIGTNTFGLSAPASGTLSVSVQATLTKDDETAMGEAFEYTLFSWPSSVSVSYTDNGESNDDGLTTESELTFAGFSVSGLDIKLSTYRITNTSTMMLENTVDIDEDDQQSLSSGYRINMRDVKPSLGANEKIHSITLKHTNGHVVSYTFEPGLDYSPFALYARKFTVDTSPAGIAINSDNTLLIPSVSTHRVHFYDTAGGDATITIGNSAVSNFGGFGTENNQLNRPHDIVVDNNGRVYVADSHNRRIQIYNADFSYNTNITFMNLVPDALHIHEGSLYVTGRGAYSIDNLQRTSTSTSVFVGVAIDGNGVLHGLREGASDEVVAGTGNPTDGFTARGHTYNMRPGNGGGSTSAPWDVVVGPTTGRIYVSDIARHQVLVLEYDGDATTNQYTLIGILGKALVGTAGQTGNGDGEFSNPGSMLIHDGELYIIDAGNNRVQVFTVPE